MSASAREAEDLAKLAVSGRMIRNGRTRRALIARLLSEQAEGSDEGDEDTSEEGGDDDRQLVRALLGSRMLKRRRLRRVLLAQLIRERKAGDDETDEYDEDVEESGDDDRQLLRLVLGSRMLRRRRVRRALLAHLIRERGEGEVGDEFDDEVDEGEDDIGEEGSDRERKFLRLLVGSRILRKRRVRRALLIKLLKERGETEDDFDEGEDEDVEEGPDLERQVARLLVGGRVVRRRRTRKAALARFLRDQD